jgi:hypothetical protein
MNLQKQRVFSHMSDLNYNDYIKNKNGDEILKILKGANNNHLNQFKNYNDFLTLTRSYYNHLNIGGCQTEVVKNIYNANIGCVKRDNFDRDICLKNECLKNECSKNALYPYSYYNQPKKCDFFFPYKINLKNWCSNKSDCSPCFKETTPCPKPPCPKPHFRPCSPPKPCNRCKTQLCNKGLCNTCNINAKCNHYDSCLRNNRLPCIPCNNNQTFNNKCLKTGCSF